MNIVLHEARTLAKSAWIWAVALCALAALYLSLFSAIARDAETFMAIFAAYPAAIQHALGVTLDSVASLPGFYTMVLTFVTLCTAIQATNAGVGILSKEARDGTSDFLYTKPVSRFAIVTSKLVAVVLVLLATDVVYYLVSSFLLIGLANAPGATKVDPTVFALLDLTILGVQFMMFSVGLAFSLLFRRLRNVLPVSLGLTFGLYLVGALMPTDDAARWVSPFQYFDLHDIVVNTRFDLGAWGAAGLVFVGGLVAAYIVTLRRDLHVR